MTSLASDIGSDYLITDLVHELSSGLEIPFLLSASPSASYDGKVGIDEISYETCKSDFFMEENLPIDFNLVQNSVEDSASEVYDVHTGTPKEELCALYCREDSGNGSSSSGSDCSSSDLWNVKNEFDTPPVTPPNDRISPDSTVLYSNKLKVIYISQEDCSRNKNAFNSLNKTVKIQPKPNFSCFSTMDNHLYSDQTIMCNILNDMQMCENYGNTNDTSGEAKNLMNTVLTKRNVEILQAKRKQERMIRNRESAYLSRKRKKEYVANLEKQVKELVTENNILRKENSSLKERLKKWEGLDSCSSGKRKKNIFIESSTKTTALLALMLTVCINVGSFSNFLNERMKGQNHRNLLEIGDTVPFHIENVRHTRSLLWSDSELENLKSSLSNVSKISCSVNQTESIRLESELRRWIRGEENFTRPVNRNGHKGHQYYNMSDRLSKSFIKLKRKSRIRKRQSEVDVKMDVFHVKPHIFDFNTFFEAINRRDDTFYLVSFSADHLLVPALAHNKTSRPKISLMLPAFSSNATSGISSDHVEMMQIDCEVTNTQLLSVNENDIPSHMRPYSNSTTKGRGPEKFSKYLVDDLSEKRKFGSNTRNFSPKFVNNYTSNTKPVRTNNHTFANDNDISKHNVYDFMNFHTYFRLNRSENHNMVRNSGNSYYKYNLWRTTFKGKTRERSDYLNNDSYTGVFDGEQFLDPNSRNILKTLILSPVLPQPKTLPFRKKTYKGTMKFPFHS